MPTLEIADPISPAAFSTIDFTGSTYPALFSTLRGFGDPPFGGSFRDTENQLVERSFQIKITGSSAANLQTNYDRLRDALSVAADRWERDRDNAIFLATQHGTTNSDDIRFRLKSGRVSEPSSVLEPVFLDQNKVIQATVFLVTEAIGELNTSTTHTLVEDLENEVDSTLLNYTDLNLGTDVAEKALIDLQLLEATAVTWNDSKNVWIWTRQGDGYDDTTFFQNSSASPVLITSPIQGTATSSASTTGGKSTNASAGSSAHREWTHSSGSQAEKTGWTPIVYFPYTISAANLPHGKFRVLARVSWEEVSGTTQYDNDGTDIAWGFGYEFGSDSVTPTSGGTTVSDKANLGDYTPMSVDEDNFQILDVGEITIPPADVPSALTSPDLELRIYCQAFGTGATWTALAQFRLSLDFIQLADTRFNFAVVEAVATAEEIQIISKGKKTGLFITDSSDVIQRTATHNTNIPWTQSGEGSARYHWLRDDTGDPTNIKCDFQIKSYRRTRGSF